MLSGIQVGFSRVLCPDSGRYSDRFKSGIQAGITNNHTE